MKKKGIHAGYEFEDGMFSRMRSWVDVAPWIRLARVLRVLASPVYVMTVLVAVILTRLVFGWWFETSFTVFDQAGSGFVPTALLETSGQLIATAGWLSTLLFICFLVAIWVPVLQVTYRAGASLSAGHGVPSVPSVIRKIVRPRMWQSYLIPFIPWACLLVLGLLCLILRLPALVFGQIGILSVITGWMIGLAGIPMGILAFGALVAVPVGIAAMVCEADPDPIDSLSRGYEYLYRRPLSVVWYLFVALVLTWVVAGLLDGIGTAASLLSSWICLSVGPDRLQTESAVELIAMIVVAWKITFASALFGGVYLLLRRDAGGQEVEDFWSPPADPIAPLPELPEQAYQS